MKYILIFASIACGTTCFSQFKLGATAGVNFANVRPAETVIVNGQLTNFYGTSITGFNVGVFTDIPLDKKIFIRPQLLYSVQGFKGPEVRDQIGQIIISRNQDNLSYLNIPLSIFYTPQLNFGKLLIGTGPYAGILLGGKIKVNSTETKIKIGNEPGDNYKRSDFGIYNSLGIQFKNRFYILGNYQFGIVDIKATSGKNKNQVISISVGYK